MTLHRMFGPFLAALILSTGLVNAQPTTFRDDFPGPSLDAAWLLRPGIGSYSLNDSPGFLRYQLTGSTHPLGPAVSLWIYRPFTDINWTLETQVSYYLPYGNGRQFWIRVPLGDLTQMNFNEVLMFRTSDQAGGAPSAGQIFADIWDGGTFSRLGPFSTNGTDSYKVRVKRDGQDVSLQLSSDGSSWATLAQRTFVTPLGSLQNVLLTGTNFAGSGYADYDYVSLTPLREVACNGFEPPMNQGPVLARQDRVFPLKAQLIENGRPLTDADITPPIIEVMFDPETGVEPISVETVAVGQASEGNQFVFTGEKWQFNLSTKSYTAPGTYLVSMKPGSPTYQISPTCSVAIVKR